MLSKEQRFQEWRGDKAAEEQNDIATALLMDNYIASVSELDTLKNEFINTKSQKFIEFNQLGGRSWGAFALLKLTIDELLEASPLIANGEINPPSYILNKVNLIFTSVSKSRGLISKQEAREFFEHIKTLLQLDSLIFCPEPLQNAKHQKKFFFMLYMLFSMANIKLNSLKTYEKFFISIIIDLNQLKATVNDVLQLIENKFKEQNLIASKSSDALQSYFDKSCLALLSVNPFKVGQQDLSIIAKLNSLQEYVANTSERLFCFIRLKKQRLELDAKIDRASHFLTILDKENNNFLKLIDDNSEIFQLVTEKKGKVELSLFRKIQKLHEMNPTANDSVKVAYGLGWMGSSLAHIPQKLLPEKAQHKISTYAYSSLERKCYILLNELVTNHLNKLRADFSKCKEEIEITQNELCHDEESKLILMSSPLEHLINLQQSLKDTQSATKGYVVLFRSLKSNLDYFQGLKKNANTLNDFIKFHHNFWVKLSNFFAQFCSIFKTNDAILVNKVIACKTKIDALCIEYQTGIQEKIRLINNDPNVAEDIKKQLIIQFNKEIASSDTVPIHYKCTRKTVRMLANNLDTFFASNPKYESVETNLEDESKDLVTKTL